MASQVNILHRDVSGGNILVYPTVETRVDASGVQTRVLTWIGILTDWELSKRLDAPLIARQPVRTVSDPNISSPDRTLTFFSPQYSREHGNICQSPY